MRGYVLTLILVLVLLIGSGLAISSNFSMETLRRGLTVPAISSDPKTAQIELLIFLGGVAAILFLIVSMGIGLAFAFNRIANMVAAQTPGRPAPSRRETAEPAAKAAASKATAEAPKIPLTDSRSLAVFWVALIVLIGGILALRSQGETPGYVPNLLATPIIPTPLPPTAAVSAATAAQGGSTDAAALQAELAALPTGDAAAGQAVFTSAGCVACHSLEPGLKIVGPSLAGVATRAATRKSGYSAELYIYESITNPSAYVVEGFPDKTMPQDFKARLTPQQLADVIAFLMTHK